MVHYPRTNYKGLIKYLRSVGLDALRIPQDTIDETGFDYYDVDEDGRPKRTGTNRIVRQRREWPSPLVYTNVLLMLDGGELPEAKTETEKPQAVKRARKPKEEQAE
jgi:hypothetical protein